MKGMFLRNPLVLFIFIVSLVLTGCSENNIAGLAGQDTTETQSHSEEAQTIDTSVVIDIAEATEAFVPRPFTDYLERSSDFVGWIKIDGTNIDAPLLRYTDNDFYLNHDIDLRPSSAGSIYIDYKNLGNFYDAHMAIYGHYMEDGTIFHDLHRYKSAAFYENYPLITISGLHETYVYEIFSVHIVSAYDYYLYFDLADEWLIEYAKHFKRQSMHEKALVKPELLENPEQLKLLTMVTCTYEFDNARLLIHAYRLEKIDMLER